MGHAPLVCESDSEAPPIARTAHVVHCACATCARVTRVGGVRCPNPGLLWKAPLAVATTSTQAPPPPAHGLGAALRWCNTNSITCGRGGGQGRPGPLRTGGGGGVGAGLLRTLQRHRNEGKTFVSAFHLVAQDPRVRPPATMVHGSPASRPLPALTKIQVEHAWCLPRVGLVKPVTRGKRAWEQPPQPVATAERSHFFVNCQPNKGCPVAPPPRSPRPRPGLAPRTPLCKYKLGPAVRGARGTRWR